MKKRPRFELEIIPAATPPELFFSTREPHITAKHASGLPQHEKSKIGMKKATPILWKDNWPASVGPLFSVYHESNPKFVWKKAIPF